jgi:hypothetical protein
MVCLTFGYPNTLVRSKIRDPFESAALNALLQKPCQLAETNKINNLGKSNHHGNP